MWKTLDNPWVNRAGNLVFVLGAAQSAVRLLMGLPFNTVGIVLLAVGIALIALPRVRARRKESPGIAKDSTVGPLDTRFEGLRDLLGRSVIVGVGLGEDGDWPLRKGWEEHSRLLVAAAYGQGEEVHVFTPDLSRQRVYRGLEIANAPRPLAEPIERLRELLGRMSSMRIRQDFEPDNWIAFDPESYRSIHALRIKELGDGERLCPWCGLKLDGHAGHCDCGAEISGDLAYKGGGDGGAAVARMLRVSPPPTPPQATLADLFKEGDDLRSQCLESPKGGLAEHAQWHLLGGTPQEQCAREDQAREWDQKVSDVLWAEPDLKHFGPGWRPAGEPIGKAPGYPDQSMKNPSRLAEWYDGKLDFLRSAIDRVGQTEPRNSI